MVQKCPHTETEASKLHFYMKGGLQIKCIISPGEICQVQASADVL